MMNLTRARFWKTGADGHPATTSALTVPIGAQAQGTQAELSHQRCAARHDHLQLPQYAGSEC